MNKAYDVFSGVLLGALIGATAVFLAEEKNRKKIVATDEVEVLRDKVSEELTKAQEKVEKSKK